MLEELLVDPDSTALFELPDPGPVRSVLVVDDDPDIRELIGHKLWMAGFRVLTAADGAAGLAAASASLPELIVLDVAMPGMSGIDVCRQLRENPRTADVPVIMLTARTNATFAMLGFMAGADLYLSKPFSPRDLVEQIKTLMSGPRPRYGDALDGPMGSGPEVVAPPVERPNGRLPHWLRGRRAQR
jgi:DNA-binding response OmpR family regulator